MAGPELSPTEQLSDGRLAYSARSAAMVLGVSDESMRRWVQTGRAPGEIRDAGSKRFFTVDADWVRSQLALRAQAEARSAENVPATGHAVLEAGAGSMDGDVLALLNRAQENSERAELRAEVLRWRERAGLLERRVVELERQLDAALGALVGLASGMRGTVEPGQ